MLKTYTGTTDRLKDEEIYEKALKDICVFRREKIDKLKCKEDKLRSLAVEGLLMDALRECNVPYDGEFEVDERGKPMLKNCPGVYYNLSHSGNRVMCVVSDKSVGCDVEKIGRVKEKTAGRICCPEEIKQLESIDGQEAKQLYLCKIWTRKESFVKNIGEGISWPLNTQSCLEYMIYNGCRYYFDTKDDGEYCYSICYIG